MIRITTILFLGLYFNVVLAQPVSLFPEQNAEKQMHFTHITRENGLPSRIVNCFIQDFNGYIWIGTADGLARFDGHDMKVFRSTPGDPESLVDNMIYSLRELSDSTIWIGTADGISVYSFKNGKFTSYSKATPGLTSLSGKSIRCFYEDKSGIVWIGTDNNLVQTTLKAGQFKLFPLQLSENPLDREYHFRNIGCIRDDPRDPTKLLLATAGGLILFDKNTGRVSKDYKHFVNKGYCLTDLYLDPENKLWTCGWGVGLSCFDLKNENWKDFPCNNTPHTFLSIVPRNDHEFLLSSPDKGLGIFNKISKRFRFYGKNKSIPGSILDDCISGISWFNQGKDLWIGTREGISIENRQVYHFRRVNLPYPFTWLSDFYNDRAQNRLYVGAYGCNGLFCGDISTQQWKIIPEEGVNEQNSLCITNLYRDSRGVLWVSTRRNLLSLDTARNMLKLFRTHDGKPLPIKDPVVYAVKEDKNSNLWIGTRFDGVFRIDPSREKATWVRHEPGNNSSLSDGTHFGAIGIDRFNQVWFGNSKGVSIYDPVKQQFNNSLMDSLHRYGIKKQWVNTVECDSLGRMWLGFDDEGLVRVEQKRKGEFSFRIFTTGKGLNVPGIDWISKDPGGTFWIVNKGLLHLNPYTESFQFYDERNGLHNNPEGATKIYVDGSGNLFMDSEGAFDMININELGVSDTLPVNLLIESVEVNGDMILEQDLADHTKKTILKADQNNLVFRYTAISYRNVEQIRYQYKMEGFDKNWIRAETSREARYTNIPPGTYIFRIRVATEGERNGCEKQFLFMIKPFFWQTWWFILAVILSISGITYVIYSYKLRQLKKLVRVRARIAADLHDDVSSTLSSISILSIILRKKVREDDSAVIVDEIGTNAQSMLERIDDIIWLVNPLNDKFENLGLRISEYAAPLFEAKDIHFTIDYPDRMLNIRLPMETRRNVFLIAKESINNILKYAECRTAEIRFNQENGLMNMLIADDGVGFDPSVQTSRNGLKNMKHRAEKINGTIRIESGHSKGTRIILQVKSN